MSLSFPNNSITAPSNQPLPPTSPDLGNIHLSNQAPVETISQQTSTTMPPVGGDGSNAVPEVLTDSSPTNGVEGLTLQQTTNAGAPETHPHIDDPEINKCVKQVLSEKTFDAAADKALFGALGDKGIIADNGTINFDKLKISVDGKTIEGKKLSKLIKKAGIQGEMFIKGNGELDYHITGKCGKAAVQILQSLQSAIHECSQGLPDGLGDKVTLNLMPQTAAGPSAEDLQVLRNGGQIMYKPADGDNVVKMALDPGNGSEGDGLSVSLCDVNGKVREGHGTKKIPLSVVYEGKEYNGKEVKTALLANWREENLFAKAQIQESEGRPTPLSKLQKQSNESNPERVGAQNKLWNAAFKYLGMTSDVSETEFSATVSVGAAEDQPVDNNAQNSQDEHLTLSGNGVVEMWGDPVASTQEFVMSRQGSGIEPMPSGPTITSQQNIPSNRTADDAAVPPPPSAASTTSFSAEDGDSFGRTTSSIHP